MRRRMPSSNFCGCKSGFRKSAHVLNKPIGSCYLKYAGTRGRFYYYICWLAQVVEGEKTGDGTNSNKCTGPRKLQSHKRFLNVDARPMASFAFLPGALSFFI
jgi:hypothetical protein